MGRKNTSYIHTNDGIHPPDEGYKLIAAAWHDGIVRTGKKGWIQQPVPRPSDSQANGTSDQDQKPAVNFHGRKIEKPELESNRTLIRLVLYLLFLLRLILIGRKAIVYLINKCRR